MGYFSFKRTGVFYKCTSSKLLAMQTRLWPSNYTFKRQLNFEILEPFYIMNNEQPVLSSKYLNSQCTFQWLLYSVTGFALVF